MKLQTILFSCLFLFSLGLAAQSEYKVAASGKTIEFSELDDLTIVGVAGSEMIISRSMDDEGDKKEDPRAKGLKKISASGRQDNTGFGVSVRTEGNVVTVEQVGKSNGAIVIQVPNSAAVKVKQSTYRGTDLKVSDFSGELNVSMHYHQVMLDNCTGPLAVNTIYGGIKAMLNKAPTKEIRLHSTYSNVELQMPNSTKANLRLSTSYGSMYTDFDVQVKGGSELGDDEGNLTGLINGGGELISLRATYKNIYLRKG
ncbi:hypothetical protein [Lewinella sp. W8]|uniref:hypothetical protein n=1 Tax=Lewinella sp. W8 TaxID=2528208 RepID=UPI0010672D74|nr:hypothetical protein [Lewinella sp. W8]MTB52763.1 hypothetical protein [Lewinella sp. W8]